MAKKEKRLTKRERKRLFGKGPSGTPKQEHIHCVACGRHIDPPEFTATPPKATYLTCQHGTRFPSCATCVAETQSRIDEHDRTGNKPRIAAAWH